MRELVIGVLVVCVSSCAPIKFSPVVDQDALYTCPGPLLDFSNVNEFQGGFTGVKKFTANGGYQDSTFTFMSLDDSIELCIHDTAGLDPDKSYHLTLEHLNKDLQPLDQIQKNWTLTVENNKGTSPKNEQCFVGKIKGGGGQFDITPGTPIGGYWKIDKTDRAISADIILKGRVTGVLVHGSVPVAPECVLY